MIYAIPVMYVGDVNNAIAQRLGLMVFEHDEPILQDPVPDSPISNLREILPPDFINYCREMIQFLEHSTDGSGPVVQNLVTQMIIACYDDDIIPPELSDHERRIYAVQDWPVLQVGDRIIRVRTSNPSHAAAHEASQRIKEEVATHK